MGEVFTSFLISVIAGVVSYYICKYARAGKKSTKKKKDITFFVVIQREDEEEYNQEYKNKRPSVDALEIKGGKS